MLIIKLNPFIFAKFKVNYMQSFLRQKRFLKMRENVFQTILLQEW